MIADAGLHKESEMPTFQVTCRELVYIDRTYEVDAEDAASARQTMEETEALLAELVCEQTQDTHSFCYVDSVHDINGNDAELESRTKRVVEIPDVPRPL